jgi:hypothetical protein
MTNPSPVTSPLVLLPGAPALSSHAHADDACDGDITNQLTIAARAQPSATVQPPAVRAVRESKVMAGIITSTAMIACLIGTSACTRGDWGWSEESAAPRLTSTASGRARQPAISRMASQAPAVRTIETEFEQSPSYSGG